MSKICTAYYICTHYGNVSYKPADVLAHITSMIHLQLTNSHVIFLHWGEFDESAMNVMQ